jgi:hypothetical protein
VRLLLRRHLGGVFRAGLVIVIVIVIVFVLMLASASRGCCWNLESATRFSKDRLHPFQKTRLTAYLGQRHRVLPVACQQPVSHPPIPRAFQNVDAQVRMRRCGCAGANALVKMH